MHFLYEAVDTTGKPLMGKMDAGTAEEVQQVLTKSGLIVQSVAPILPRTPASSLFSSASPAPAQTFDAPAAAPVWMPSAAPRLQPVDLSTIGTPGQDLTSTVPVVQSAPPVSLSASPVQKAVSTPSSLGGKIILSGNAASLAQNAPASRVTPSVSTAFSLPKTDSISYAGGVTDRDRLLFFQQLASLVRSGMSIYASLDNLAPRTPAKNLSKAAMEMASAARTGGQISTVMARYPVLFPEYITATVKAGETGGFLEVSLAEIALNYGRKIDLYRGAWIPKLMAAQSLFMIPIVLPLMSTLLREGSVGEHLLEYLRLELTIYLPITFALFFGAKFAFRRVQMPQFTRWRDQLALKVPPFNELQRQESLGSFVRMLRRLFEAGVAPITAWEGAMDVSGNQVIREKLRSSHDLMKSGASFSEAFAATGLFNSQIENLVITGQQSGQVVEMLDQAADYYDTQSQESAKRAKFTMLRIGIIAMLVFGGAAFLWTVKSYFAAIFRYTDHFAD